ncbi:DUF6383 domain-containing protein [Parabacteroides johnsonii]|uniref:DUF6383 domain-containing protein n=1 Tax=Parabacteroides johnsonii TaxID=387661 RepID=UPI002674112C|nr:DUF6383 domain-containing protein [Parabacteroides johnsonii]
MNKKFSTLLAGVALFGAMTANAGDAVTSLQKTGNGLYQLKAANGVLAMTPEGYLQLVDAVTSEKLASTLWCVEVTEEGFGKAPIFDFTNKATGQRLDIAYAGTLLEGVTKETPTYNFKTPTNADSTIVGGEVSGWAYLSQYKLVSSEEQTSGKTLYSYFKADSVIGLKADGTNIQLVKLGADKASADAAAGSELTAFVLQEADMIRLKANEINTILGLQDADKGVELKFTPDEEGEKVAVANPFNGKNGGKFLTADVKDDTEGYVYVLKSDSSYLRVDTTVVNASGERFRAFAWSDLKYATLQKGLQKHQTAHDSIDASPLKDQYKFAFSYYPSKDSLVIQVKEAKKYTATPTVTGSNWDASDNTILPDNKGKKGENNFVTVQDLIKNKVRIVTVYNKKETNISLGYKGCAPATSDKTSKDNGLYVIYNEKGQVLASPIHKDGDAYEWVTLDEQNPQHMPAYQWFVQKTQIAENMQPTSPIKITNREFDDAATVQLRLKDEKVIVDAFSVAGSSIAAATVVNFVQITDSTILKDPYLGYRKFDKDSLKVAKYKFNYLHPYAQDKWIKRGEDKDSILYATDGYTAFNISEGTQVQYGAVPANVNGLKGIAKLYRNQYLISLDADTVGVGAENKIVLGKVAALDSVYFKENNHYDGKHYYAIVNASEDEIDATKIGVADDGMTANLKQQPLEETRTSAFAISVDDKPLYRRFNNVALNESATDAADTLRFLESVRGEYLMDENNREGGLMDANVDYLGIWTADKATGLGFHVDTAWVNRGLGYIKPQYLISANRTIVGQKDGYICEETTGHIKADGTPTDKAEECYHSRPATPGFVHAKFLVSFQDSVAKIGKDKPYTDIKNGYTRVGFVKAIQSDDKLFILVNGFENMKPEELDTATIAKAYTDAKIYNTYVKSLKGDAHKNYTWSFRYVNPEDAANVAKEGPENAFLIESNSYEPTSAANKDIAPEKAAWIKMQNGCIVLTDNSSTFSNAKTGGDGALIFNVENKEDDQLATDNEEIATSEVTVIAQQGAVRVANAAGKKVVVTNILGQTVANTVITSSDATIAAPQGVVVVAVEGEEAVKAIVK